MRGPITGPLGRHNSSSGIRVTFLNLACMVKTTIRALGDQRNEGLRVSNDPSGDPTENSLLCQQELDVLLRKSAARASCSPSSLWMLCITFQLARETPHRADMTFISRR